MRLLAVIFLLAGCASTTDDARLLLPHSSAYIDTSEEWQERAALAAANARLSEASSNLSRVAAGAITLGVLAFLFGHLLAIPRWVAASTIGLGTLTATTAPQLLAFFGSESAQHLMLATFALLALAGVTSAGVWLYRKLFNRHGPQA